jgi:hypothetical protein
MRRFLHERDLFAEIYRVARLLILLIFTIVMVEKYVFTTVKVSESYPESGLKKGTYLLVWRENFFLKLKRENKSFFVHNNSLLSGVIAGVPGESVKLINGEFFANNNFFPDLSYTSEYPLSAEYSPRDNVSAFLLPKKGELVTADNSIESVCRFYQIVKQERSGSEIVARFFIDGVEQDMLFIKDFILYKGLLSSISEQQKSSSHFWKSLLSWYKKNREGVPSIILSVRVKGDEIPEYKVKNSYYYLLNQDYLGFDSRYSGPISDKNIIGVMGWKFPFFGDDKQ